LRETTIVGERAAKIIVVVDRTSLFDESLVVVEWTSLVNGKLND
jgi:hypothetical protein